MIIQKLSVLIVEPNSAFSMEMEDAVREIGYKSVTSVTDLDAALAIIDKQTPGLVLLNIGLQTNPYFSEDLEYIKQLDIPVMFISDLSKFDALNNSKITNAIGYLIKPVDRHHLQTCIQNTVQLLEEETAPLNFDNPYGNKDYLFFKIKGTYQKVKTSNIYFFQASGDYIIAQTFNRDYTLSIRMNKLEEELLSSSFMRVHRSYMVNLNRVDIVDTDKNLLDINGYEIPFSRKYRTEILERLPVY